jgi:hypothetical protein
MCIVFHMKTVLIVLMFAGLVTMRAGSEEIQRSFILDGIPQTEALLPVGVSVFSGSPTDLSLSAESIWAELLLPDSAPIFSFSEIERIEFLPDLTGEVGPFVVLDPSLFSYGESHYTMKIEEKTG